ncbi:MAG TPA: hypothetical protein VEI54_09005 [Candidatus Limnocylindrales bacterium]|nr:hypothetical protein [Candidatus Limnocylindrales bacterium]
MDEFGLKTKQPASTHKKVVVELQDRKLLRGYMNPTRLPQAESIDLLTPEGEHEEVPLGKLRAIHFVRKLEEDIEMDRKSFLSRPKLDGLWVRLRFKDGESLEGVIPNDLLGFLDNGLQITPPDFNANTDRIFVPRSALTELTVLGVVGIARRKPAAGAEAAQPRLFNE